MSVQTLLNAALADGRIRVLVKGCACGKTFTAAEWARLPFPPGGGIQRVAEDLESCSCGFRESDARTRLSGWPPAGVVGHRPGCPGAPGALEMRNCPCGSTLVLPEILSVLPETS